MPSPTYGIFEGGGAKGLAHIAGAAAAERNGSSSSAWPGPRRALSSLRCSPSATRRSNCSTQTTLRPICSAGTK